MHSTVIALSVLATLVFPMASPRQDSLELAAVLDRAAQYVALYEDRLGDVGAAESYRQVSVAWSDARVRTEQERRMESDFLIYRDGVDRIGLRIVRRVDGVPVQRGEATFEALLDNSPEAIKKGIAALRQQSAQYNIGPVIRTFNVPTFALKVVRKEQLSSFVFVKRGVEKTNGVQVWDVTFKERKERRDPTLVQGNFKEYLFSEGSLWIEPATGRILKTEFLVENPYSKPKAKSRMVVTYTENKRIGLYLPGQMIERYETEDGFIEARADYSNFVLFGVDARSEIAAPNPQVQ